MERKIGIGEKEDRGEDGAIGGTNIDGEEDTRMSSMNCSLLVTNAF